MATKTIPPEVLTILQEWDRCEQMWRAALAHVDEVKAMADGAYRTMKHTEAQLRPHVPDPEVFVSVGPTLFRLGRNGYGEPFVTRVTVATVAESTPAQADGTTGEDQP